MKSFVHRTSNVDFVMPLDNRFQHQPYHLPADPAKYRLVVPAIPDTLGSHAYQASLHSAGASLRRARVAHIVVVHGTLTGTDASGLNRAIYRFAPQLGVRLGRARKQLVDGLIGDLANYNQEFVQQFRNGIQAATVPADERSHPEVSRFLWSSENNHLGRADAAVRLLDRLFELQRQTGERILLWGHSHAGNVFALMTNLLGGDRVSRAEFLKATEDFQPHDALEPWARIRQFLSSEQPRIADFALDIVTFGTPIRYGWEQRGYENLLHFVNHRPLIPSRPANAVFPLSLEQFRDAASGDYFQQLFIAGTNYPPNFWARRDRQVDRRLNTLLQRDVAGTLRERLQYGCRVAQDGLMLLVDYAAAQEADKQVSFLGGHGVYTRLAWLPFHLHHVIAQFYREA